MAKRHDDALYIQAGACNGSGIARSLVKAYDEVRAEPNYTGTDMMNRDAAVQLILHQLCHLALISTDDHPHETGFHYDRSYQECVDNASDEVVATCAPYHKKTGAV
jgi:hypothetical protein